MSSIYGSASGGNVIYGKNNYGVAFGGNGAIAPTFNENYESTSGWTFVPVSGSTFTINDGGNGLLLSTDTPMNVLNQCYRSIGSSLSSQYTLKIEFMQTSVNNAIYPVAVTEDSTQIESQSKGIGIKADFTAADQGLTLFSVSSGTLTQASSYIYGLFVDTQYYIKIVNDDSNITMSIFTNPDYATSQQGSDISITDPNFTTLDTLQHCGRDSGDSDANKSFAINNFSMQDDT